MPTPPINPMRPRPTPDEVLAAVRRLAANPRRVPYGASHVELPGGSTVDLTREVGCSYADLIRPAVQVLLDRGEITERRIGPYRCYVPVTPGKESAA